LLLLPLLLLLLAMMMNGGLARLGDNESFKLRCWL
jgi:hypothetical protein